MKHILLLSILITNLALADCNVKIASQLANERRVGPIVNLIKDTHILGQCTVNFDMDVDGKTYHLQETEKGWENPESLCYYARERARKNFLMDMPGNFKTETVTSCREGELVPMSLKKGDTVLETEAPPSPMKKSFTYRNSQCRMFQEHMVIDRELKVYNGVICKIDNSSTNWLVVDKW
jgi:hypothetical protein